MHAQVDVVPRRDEVRLLVLDDDLLQQLERGERPALISSSSLCEVIYFEHSLGKKVFTALAIRASRISRSKSFVESSGGRRHASII